MADPEKESGKQQGLSKEAWTAISAVVVAVIGGVFTLANTLLNKQPSPSPSSTPSSGTVISPAPSSPSTSTPPQPEVANIPLGKWSGEAKEHSGKTFPINVEINQVCSLNKKCGYISVPKVPCYGEISFVNTNSDYYEFNVSNFDTRSSPNCTPGAGELFRLLPDGRLAYKATYSDAEGVLEKVGNNR